MKELNVGSHLSRYWQIYVSMVAIISFLSINGSDIGNLKIQQAKSEEVHEMLLEKINNQQIQYAEIQSRLASIDTSLQYLKER